MKFKKKPVVIEAHQWFRNGDHPEDDVHRQFNDGTWPTMPREGAVVRFFVHPDQASSDLCPECRHGYCEHGWIDTKEGGHRVCPGDWIITGVEGERYPCKPDIFQKTYECVEER